MVSLNTSSNGTIWGLVEPVLRKQNPNATNADIAKATQVVLDKNGITQAEAKSLSPTTQVDLSPITKITPGTSKPATTTTSTGTSNTKPSTSGASGSDPLSFFNSISSGLNGNTQKPATTPTPTNTQGNNNTPTREELLNRFVNFTEQQPQPVTQPVTQAQPQTSVANNNLLAQVLQTALQQPPAQQPRTTSPFSLGGGILSNPSILGGSNISIDDIAKLNIPGNFSSSVQLGGLFGGVVNNIGGRDILAQRGLFFDRIA